MDDFFEGQEKLLEIWFKPANGRKPLGQAKHPTLEHARGLRSLSREQINDILSKANCLILDSYHNEYIDSYVLSESSLFITAHRIIIKTCGTTTLLSALPLILKYAAGVGLTEIEDVCFSRRQLMQPTKQLYPHQDFADEVEFLEQYFEGVAYPLGRLNGDRWFLYTLDRPLHITCPDTTIEIMMRELSPDAMKIFYKNTLSGKEVTKQSGIADIIPEAHIHESLFDPCGYSCNGIIGHSYFTIHVTPQPEFSFVSFETDYQLDDYTDMIVKVLKIFKPGRFSVNLFANDQTSFGNAANAFDIEVVEGAGFRRQDQQTCQLSYASVLYGHFASSNSAAAENKTRRTRQRRPAALTVKDD
eukprot:m.89810 g.89810  ORF g.89810 m.89810 type:complete len:359 (+) comp14592_c0_seq4:833-1909(+)